MNLIQLGRTGRRIIYSQHDRDVFISFAVKIQDGCYGAFLAMDCGSPSLRIRIVNETYGRNPTDRCSPSDSGGDCSVDPGPGPLSTYRNLCNGNTSCEHLGVPWQYINRTGCVDIYTNYVHIIYQCYSNARRFIHIVFSNFPVKVASCLQSCRCRRPLYNAHTSSFERKFGGYFSEI